MAPIVLRSGMPTETPPSAMPPEPPHWRRHATAYLIALSAAVLVVALLIAAYAIFKG